jgi:hypothetical protein
VLCPCSSQPPEPWSRILWLRCYYLDWGSCVKDLVPCAIGDGGGVFNKQNLVGGLQVAGLCAQWNGRSWPLAPPLLFPDWWDEQLWSSMCSLPLISSILTRCPNIWGHSISD